MEDSNGLETLGGYSLPYTPKYVLIETEEEALKALKEFSSFPVLALDTETTGLDPFDAKLLLYQIATPDMCYILNCTQVDPSVWNPMLENKDIVKLAQFAQFDYKMLKVKTGASMRPIFCTMIAERLITVGKQVKTNLKYIAHKYLGMDIDKGIRDNFVNKYKTRFTKEELEYAANDALILHEIYNHQIDALQRDELITVAMLEFNTIVPNAEMELAGCLIDQEKWVSLFPEVRKKRDKLEDEVQGILLPGCDQRTVFGKSTINLKSPKQLLYYLERIGIKLDSTDEPTLKKSNAPVAKKLLEWRHWNTAITKYGDKFLDKIREDTGRLHANFNQVRTKTGRESSSDPNLQQVPGFDPEDPDSINFRSCFIAPPGYKIIGCDYGQQELRILAEIANDKNLLDAFRRGEDVHEKMACLVFNKTPDTVTKTERLRSKTTNFTITFGGSAFTVARRLDIPEEEGEKIVDGYFKAFPGVKDYIASSGNFAVQNGYSLSISGRRRNYNVPHSSDPEYGQKMKAIKRQAANARIQGSAADVSKQGMCNFFYALEEKGYDAKLVMFVHDELLVQAREDQAEEVAKLLEESMIKGFSDFFKRIPMVAEAEIGDCWEH